MQSNDSEMDARITAPIMERKTQIIGGFSNEYVQVYCGFRERKLVQIAEHQETSGYERQCYWYFQVRGCFTATLFFFCTDFVFIPSGTLLLDPTRLYFKGVIS